MTTSHMRVERRLSAESAFGRTNDDQTVEALAEAIFGDHESLHREVRDVVAGLSDVPRSGLTYSQQTEYAPDLLRAVIKQLGHPARDIAADAQLRGALCDWAQVAAPPLLLILTGHFDLAVGAILELGNESQYQQECLAELDTAATIGVLMLTELGGTNGADQQTTATWDSSADGFWLSTPSVAAAKFMPNVADSAVPKTVVVTARMLVDGHDEGVLPFLLKLRRPTSGLATGVHVAPLPDKSSAPMDHAMIRFEQVWVPRDALLGGKWATMHPDGRFECTLAPRQRFHAAIGTLSNGRLDLANAAIASARAGLAGLVNYTNQRRPGSGPHMADRDAVQRDIVSGLTAAYATSVLGRHIRDMRADSGIGEREQALWSMLAKPLLSNTAYEVLTMCRERTAAQGALRINHILDWVGNLEAIITAEGENQIMQVAAGRAGTALTTLRLPQTPQNVPWFIDMLTARERSIEAGFSIGNYEAAGIAAGPDSAAIELATATAERLAATALFTESLTITDPMAKELVASAAAAYALERIYSRGAWYAAHHQMTASRAAAIVTELHNYHAILAKHLPTMVMAFRIPKLPGPIFSGDYLQAWQDHTGWDDACFPAGI